VHTYATVEDLKAYLAGDSSSYGTATGGDDTLLTLLEGASRRVEGWTMRSDFGSGYGPRIGTNRYDHDGSSTLLLDDDLIGATGVSVLDATGGSTVSFAADTDYYLKPYSGPPYTELVVTGLGEGLTSGLRVVSIAGTFGYSATTTPAGTVALATGSATTATVTGATVYAGATLLVGSEQVYVTASTGGTALTVERGQNGTTAAAGTAAASQYQYPREVVTATLQLAARRHRSAQSGLTGDFGGGNLPQVGNRDNETSILRGTVAHLRRWAAG
jgi:hypothetical protein